jgi:hypothetical protein
MTRFCIRCNRIIGEKCVQCGTEATANSNGHVVSGAEFDCPSCGHRFPQGDGGETGGTLFSSERKFNEVMLMQTLRSISSIRCLLLVVVMLFIPPVSFGQAVGISIVVAPPALPVYVQPICPGDNYIWTPGYWAYSDDDEDYYWVPGTWVLAPTPGFLWTPGYWGWNNGVYLWNGGYWGPHIGFYGGVNYGYGYVGEGYEGGYWRGDNFFYNRTVNNVNVTVIHNVYNKTVVNNYTSVNRASFNGPGGVDRKPTRQEETYAHEQHTRPTAAQTEHQHAAVSDRSQFASVNHGKPAVAATARPGDFKGAGVVPAKAAAPYKGATGKGATNARGAKTDGASTAANRTNAPARSTTPAHNTEHTNAGATSEHKTTNAGAKPPAHENTAHTGTTPHTTPRTESTPKAQPKHEAVPRPQHEAAPKPQPQHEAAPRPQPQHETAPKPQPQHEAAPRPQPQQHEAAPKPQSKPEEKPH